MNAFEPSGRRRELARAVGRIQALMLELEELRRQPRRDAEREAKERKLERLRWELASLARRTATGDLGNAA